ncbi:MULTISPECIES: glycosyltransferase family 4 protein [unclassified Marinobacter]|uniref:glycosyltransferase family 4 protein n=1 Tax=unclassified Marinobacter TaxID=83889 RepID=UPI001269602B|nr:MULTISPECIES: glycosyltransferase family 4 protein [unclassified Marinobacter]QFS86924.1 Alpha-D-kanosaminyltransferase [Marinobacter sp. THAF197a]QFT50708.1 Alpha-D-kanosaminyltransferase [Marinobacter sp. THAF39]
MNIILVYKEDYPWDVRVEKLALALTEQGHSVTIVSRNLEQRPIRETDNNLKLLRLPRLRLLPLFLRKLLNLPLWFNPLWIFRIFRAVHQDNVDLIIVRDLPLVRSALILKRILGTKVVLDMAEVYPEMYASSAKFSDKSVVQRLVKSPEVAERYESSVLPKLDHTLVMIEESRDRLLKKDIPEQQISIVSNTPPIDKFSGSVHQHSGTSLHLVYVGFLTELRGLDLLIHAVAQYVKRGNTADSIRVDIVGKGASKPKLERLVTELGVAKSVTIHGWLSHESVNELMAAANVGSLTYRVCGHWNHTIPNKIFDYMLAGLPVLTTEVIPIRRIVEQSNCGLVCKDQNTADIAEKLEQLRDPHLRQLLGRNGHNAVIETYNWENDKARLAQAISSLDSGSG